MRSVELSNFIQDCPNETHEILNRLRDLVHELCPDCSECIAYGIPTFDYKKQHMIHFAGYPKHIGLYPGADGIEAFKHRFAGYKYAKGSVQFSLTQDIPYELIKEIILYRKNACEK